MLPKLNRVDNMSNRMIAGDRSMFHDESSGMKEIFDPTEGKTYHEALPGAWYDER